MPPLQVSEDRPTFRNSHPADGASRSHHLHGNLGFTPVCDERLRHYVVPHPETFQLCPSGLWTLSEWPGHLALQDHKHLLHSHIPVFPRLPGLLLLQHLPPGVVGPAEAAGVLQLHEACKVAQKHASAGQCLLLLLRPLPPDSPPQSFPVQLLFMEQLSLLLDGGHHPNVSPQRLPGPAHLLHPQQELQEAV